MQTLRGTEYTLIEQSDSRLYMVPKQYASKFNRRTKLVAEGLNAADVEKAKIVSQIIKINRSIPKSVVAFPVKDFLKMVEKYGV